MRNNDLLAIQNGVSLADHRCRVGDTVEVLVEGPSKTELKASRGREAPERTGPMQLTGRAMTDHIVVLDGNRRLIGRTISVQIKEATAFTLFGTVVTGEQVGVDHAGAQWTEPTQPACDAEATIGRRIGLPLIRD